MQGATRSGEMALAAMADPRRLGIYYTPDGLADVLVQWALPSKAGRVLDPSFGGCSFLRAALALAPSGKPGTVEVFGVDVDSEAHHHGMQLCRLGVPSTNLIQDDFFAVTPDRFGGLGFEAVVGNPPYIRHHWLSGEPRRLAEKAAWRAGLPLDGRADSWAYFVVHSLSFLRGGGRIAFLLPGAVLHADYAAAVLEHLRLKCSQVRLIRIGERIFHTAREATVVLTAEDFGGGPGQLIFDEVRTAGELAKALTSPPRTGQPTSSTERRLWSLDQLSSRSRDAWKRATDHDLVRPLGEIARIRIGVVTGANEFFVRPTADVVDLVSLGALAVPVVCRARDLWAPRFTKRDLGRLDRTGRPARLLAVPPTLARLSGRLRRLVETGQEQGLHLRYHTSRRDRWYELDDTEAPDAFLAYMAARPTRPSLNVAGATCTNGVHRLWWKGERNHAAAVIVGAWTTLFGLGAEVHGRHYGGGVLKLEPSEAARVPVPIVDGAGCALHEIDRLARAGSFAEAIAVADQAVLQKGLGLSDREVAELQLATGNLASRRMALRKR